MRNKLKAFFIFQKTCSCAKKTFILITLNNHYFIYSRIHNLVVYIIHSLFIAHSLSFEAQIFDFICSFSFSFIVAFNELLFCCFKRSLKNRSDMCEAHSSKVEKHNPFSSSFVIHSWLQKYS